MGHRETVWLKPKDPFRGIPPTDKEAIVASVDIYRILDGRIVEQWNHPDLFGQMY
jgi:predicted ester cyclase